MGKKHCVFFVMLSKYIVRCCNFTNSPFEMFHCLSVCDFDRFSGPKPKDSHVVMKPMCLCHMIMIKSYVKADSYVTILLHAMCLRHKLFHVNQT